MFFKPYNPLETFADFEISENTEESVKESEITENLMTDFENQSLTQDSFNPEFDQIYISRRSLNFDFQTKEINSYREKIAGKLFEQKMCADF